MFGRIELRNLWGNLYEDCFFGFISFDEFSFSFFKFILEGEKGSYI